MENKPTYAAKSTRISGRLEQLSRAKKRPAVPERDPEWKVAPKTMKNQPSKRVRELSQSKKLAEGFQVNTSDLSGIRLFNSLMVVPIV